VSVYFWHGLRWQTLLRPVVRLKYWEPVRAIYVGLFANEVLPFRAGEVLRCYLLARNPQLPLSVSLTSALIERIFDGIWLSMCIILMLRYTVIPHSLRFLVDGAYVLGISVLVVALVLGDHVPRHETRARWLATDGGGKCTCSSTTGDYRALGYLWAFSAKPLPAAYDGTHLCHDARIRIRFLVGSGICADGGTATGDGSAGSGNLGLFRAL
jgi:uncharacterized membrane protein YbhN (UPF0104 family)